MSATPLVNLVQAIHLPSHRFLLTTSAAEASPHKVTLHLFAHTPSSDGNGGSSSDGSGSGYGADGNRLPSIIVWEGELDLKVKGAEQDVLADAIKKGYLHVDMPLTNMTELSSAEELDLKILPPDRDPSTYPLFSVPLSAAIPHLLEATFELLSRPAAMPDKSELRSLRSQLAQKDAEVASLSAKLASAKATVVRATASDNSNKKKMVSPVKKAPANASALQPNVKRRKVVKEDEDGDFAGSDSD